MRVKGKSIIVTGSGGGIGEGIAKRLAEEGAHVIVNDINREAGEKVTAQINTAGGKASFFAADVTKSADMKALLRLVKLTGRTDLQERDLPVARARQGRPGQGARSCSPPMSFTREPASHST